MRVGIDQVDIYRMDKYVDNMSFLSKYFTKRELEYLDSAGRKNQTLAGLYACKEAVIKAMGAVIGGGQNLKNIEVLHNGQGRPYIELNEYILSKLSENQFTAIDVSITHSEKIASAICIIY